jgi:hypothetical protein
MQEKVFHRFDVFCEHAHVSLSVVRPSNRVASPPDCAWKANKTCGVSFLCTILYLERDHVR